MLDQIKMNKSTFKEKHNAKSKWSDKEIEYLKKNIGVKTQFEMAYELGRTYGAVRYKVSKLGITSNNRSLTDDLPLIMDMIEQGLTYDQIADKVGCAKNTLYQLLLPYQPTREQQYNLILENYKRLSEG